MTGMRSLYSKLMNDYPTGIVGVCDFAYSFVCRDGRAGDRISKELSSHPYDWECTWSDGNWNCASTLDSSLYCDLSVTSFVNTAGSIRFNSSFTEKEPWLRDGVLLDIPKKVVRWFL